MRCHSNGPLPVLSPAQTVLLVLLHTYVYYASARWKWEISVAFVRLSVRPSHT